MSKGCQENIRYSSEAINSSENTDIKTSNIDNHNQSDFLNSSITDKPKKYSSPRENSLKESNQELIAEIAYLQTINIKKEEKIKFLMGENSHLKAATENLEDLKMKIHIYEQIDFPSILMHSDNKSAINTEIFKKIKSIEADYGKEINQLNAKIEELKLQIYNMNNNRKDNQINSSDQYNSNNDLITEKDNEIMELKIKVARVEISIDIKTNQIKRLEDDLEQQRSLINKLMMDNNIFNSNTFTQHLINNNNNVNSLNFNHDYCVKRSIHSELKSKLSEAEKNCETLQEELDSEKNKYLSILEMNQDLGKKVIENMKIMKDYKSEILYLKKKVSEMQKEKCDTKINNEFNENNFYNSEIEEKQKESEIRLQFEKANQEQKLIIAELIEQQQLLQHKMLTLTEELNLEKLENENLKEIQKSDLKNISKILSENNSQQQQKKNEEMIQELKTSLQNTNKINQELTNQKINLEKEIKDFCLKLGEKHNSLMLISAEKDFNQNQMLLRDDKSIAAFSKYSMATNLTNNKFYDLKFKDLEDSLVQEKENNENLLKIKQRIVEKLKKSNENLLADKNKLMREIAEEKMKNNSLIMEKNSLLESEGYFNAQIQELNAEIEDLKLYQDNYELIEEKLEEFQKQFANLVNVYNNPQMRNEQFKKIVNENVELNAYKTKYFDIECEMQEKNKDVLMLKDKLYFLERKVSMQYKSQNSSKPEQISSDFNNNNINLNSINSISEKCSNCALLEINLNKFKKILDDYNVRTTQYQTEINELKNTNEDNKLVIFSLREKCKDAISKDKEILRLNIIITELNNRKKKKVSFGKAIVVEYKKDNSAYDPINEKEEIETEIRSKEDVAAFKLSDLLKSQEHLFEKYQKEFDGLKKFRTLNFSTGSSENNKENNLGGSENSTSNNDNNNSSYDVNSKYENLDKINNCKQNNKSLSYDSDNFYKSEDPTGVHNLNKGYNNIENYISFQQGKNEINFEKSRNQEAREEEEQKDDTELNLSPGKINIEPYKNLNTNLEFVFEGIKNKHNLNEGEKKNSLTDKYSDNKNSNAIFKSFMEKLNLASMSKSEVFSTDNFEKIANGESNKENN